MAQTTPQIGLGSKVEMSSSVGPASYALFGFVVNFTGPNRTTAPQDTTHMLSTWKENIPGIPDGGEVSVESHYAEDHATHNTVTGVKYFHDNRIQVLLKITTPGATNEEIFLATVVGVEPTRNFETVMKITAKFKLSGAPTSAAAGT